VLTNGGSYIREGTRGLSPPTPNPAVTLPDARIRDSLRRLIVVPGLARGGHESVC